MRHFRSGRKTGRENQICQPLRIDVFVCLQQTRFDTARANPLEIEASTVVGKAEDDFVAFLLEGKRDLADLGLALLHPRLAILDAVRDGVAQQVLEWRGHLVEHAAVEFDLAALDFKIDALVQLLRRLPDDTVETIGKAAERNHAHGHQLLLHLAVQARLGDDCRIGVIQVLQKILLNGRHVVDRLGHHPRQFLEAGEAVELQRIEAGMMFIGGLRGPRLHLRFGLDFDLAQLATQTNDVFRQIEERLLQAAHLAFDSRTRNRQLASLVHQAINQIGANT